MGTEFATFIYVLTAASVAPLAGRSKKSVPHSSCHTYSSNRSWELFFCMESGSAPAKRHAGSRSTSAANQEQMQGALLGAGLTLGLTLVSHLFIGVFRRGKKTKIVRTTKPHSSNPSTCASTPRAKGIGRGVELRAFGSPTLVDAQSPRMAPQACGNGMQPAYATLGGTLMLLHARRKENSTYSPRLAC